MKVLILANHFITLYSFRKELIRRLIEEKHEVYLSLPICDENSFFANLGCKIISTDIDRRGVNPIKDFKLIKQYKKMMKDIVPDIIFSYTIKPNIYGCFVSNRLHIKQICNITGTGGTFLKKNLVATICKILYKSSIKKCYKVFFQNTGDRDFFLKNKLVKNNYDLLPGSGCNLEEHPYFPMPNDRIVRFIFIGRVMKLKGIEEYLASAKTIKSEFPNTEFLIAGWNEEEKYKSTINEYQTKGYIKYIGFRNDIDEWIKSSHCIILPSHGGEGVPNVLLEGSAIGRACIGSNISGTNDVIKDGITGFLFEVGNVNDLVLTIKKFLKLSYNEKTKMGVFGRKNIEKKYNRNIVVQTYLEELKK